MRIVALREKDEPRVSLVPDSIKKLLLLEGIEVAIEESITDMISNETYSKAGASIIKSRDELLSTGDLFLWVNEPALEDIGKMKK